MKGRARGGFGVRGGVERLSVDKHQLDKMFNQMAHQTAD